METLPTSAEDLHSGSVRLENLPDTSAEDLHSGSVRLETLPDTSADADLHSGSVRLSESRSKWVEVRTAIRKREWDSFWEFPLDTPLGTPAASEAGSPQPIRKDGVPAPSAPEEKNASNKPEPKKGTATTHISGLRALLSYWIVVDHMTSSWRPTPTETPQEGLFTLILGRAIVPVQFFIVLSGFITHHAYRKVKYYDGHQIVWSQVARYNFKRFGGIIGAYYLTYSLILIVIIISQKWALEQPGAIVSVVLSVFLLQSWYPLECTVPNGSAWTMSTLAFAWVLFPPIQHFLKKSGSGCRAFLLFLLASIVTVAPCALYVIIEGPVVSHHAYDFLYKFPPIRLADFVLGMTAAELLAQTGDAGFVKRHKLKIAVAGDLLALAIVATVALAFVPPEGRWPGFEQWARYEEEGSRYEVFWISAAGPFFSLFLWTSCAAGGGIAHACRHPALSAIGDLGFQVYLSHNGFVLSFFTILHAATDALMADEGISSDYEAYTPGASMAALLTIYLVAAVIKGFVDDPVRRRVHGWVDRRFPAKRASPKVAALETIATPPPSAPPKPARGGDETKRKTRVSADIEKSRSGV